MLPTRRDFRFHLPPSRVRNWHGRGAHVSHFFNALSIFFPVGERYFIASVRAHRNRVTDAGLNDEVGIFIGQEAMHGREHESYNRLIAQAGLPADKLERCVAKVLSLTQQATPPAWQLSSTIALEHFTAILADRLLRDDELLQGSVEEFRNLWLWHSIEETEHKGVAYDVWQQVMGRGAAAYAVRTGGMLVTAAAFVTLVTAFSAVLIENDPHLRDQRGGYRELLQFLLGRKGLVRASLPAWLAYFRPSFHPWQHDNRALLRKIKRIGPQARTTAMAQAA
ncbi:MAG: hypothetical protein JWR16_3625 [Nevskia sp.]|nr:hypothetical protein [Nevskia sp.]